MHMEPSNQERTATARFAVEAYAARNDSDAQSLEENIIDLLADLHHLVTAEGIGFSRCLTMAGLHHEAELPESYNGWTNYETWAVHLWLTNEQGSYFYWQEQARSHIEDAPGSQQVRGGIWTEEQAARFGLADQFREELEDGQPIQGASVYSDLLSSVLDDVNWSEIAQAFIDEAEE